MSPEPGSALAPDRLLELVQELLDAHLDTAELATQLAPEPAWELHLGYLRALHRRGTELLAAEAEAIRR